MATDLSSESTRLFRPFLQSNFYMKKIRIFTTFCILLVLVSCRNTDTHTAHKGEPIQEIYTCSMHPEIIRDKPGNCPICGMVLIKKEVSTIKPTEIDLESLLRPTNVFVISSIPVTTMEKREEEIEIKTLGNIAYDTREIGNISSKVSGRIEKLLVRFRYQKITKGQHIMDIYSPELSTAQQNLLFLLSNDASNTGFIQAAKEKLLLLGMSTQQLQQVIRSGIPSAMISVYSNYSGHIHEALNSSLMDEDPGAMKEVSLLTEELSIKEGMYVERGQTVFKVYNPGKVWIILNIYENDQGLVKKGNAVKIAPETTPGKDFWATVDYIEPFYRKESKTLTARVYYNNRSLGLPIGSQVKATIYCDSKKAYWLPKAAVLSLGMDRIVFLKENDVFRAHKVSTGVLHHELIEITGGLSPMDSVATNAQYLMDSESFIKTKE